eukprot:3667551-Amphidinium_carterae.1
MAHILFHSHARLHIIEASDRVAKRSHKPCVHATVGVDDKAAFCPQVITVTSHATRMHTTMHSSKATANVPMGSLRATKVAQ